MSRRLPLFPLDVVLFPGARTPLHIFEPRYRTLVADCLAGDNRFGLVPPARDGGAPARGTVGSVALIVVHQALPDGRSNILVEGESRFVIEDVEGPHPYFVATVSTFTDEQAGGILPGDTADSLRRLGNRCRAAVAALTDEPGEEGWATDAERLTFQVAGTLPWSSEQARDLLRSRSAEARADLLLKVLPRLLPDLESRASVHRRATTNGKGAHPPDEGPTP